MTADETSSDGAAAPTKAGISSKRISRRALLTLVLGAGFAAAAIGGGASALERRRKVGPARRMQRPQALGQAKKRLPNPYGSAVKQINKQKLKASCPGGYVAGNRCLFDF